jgi:hypothetical protein
MTNPKTATGTFVQVPVHVECSSVYALKKMSAH